MKGQERESEKGSLCFFCVDRDTSPSAVDANDPMTVESREKESQSKRGGVKRGLFVSSV